LIGPAPRAFELLIELDRSAKEPLRRQLEDKLRAAIENRTLPDGTRLPSSRSLAGQLGVSRGVVVDAYEQLAAQGLLMARPRQVPVVRSGPLRSPAPTRPLPRYRFVANPNAPDLSLFPRRAWARAATEVMRELPDDELDYPPDSGGSLTLRSALAGYLARVRRVRADADTVVLTVGFLHGFDLVCRTLARRGISHIAVENPSIPEQAAIAERNGIAIEPIAVDDAGIVVDHLLSADARAVIVTPAHQFPLGVVMSPERRRALVDWARERDALIVENDYDAEFRYNGPPIGAVQGLAPERTVYLGTTSKSLAPAVRLGWIVAPVASELSWLFEGGGGFAGLNGTVIARLLESGVYERHVQRCRREYRRRRDALVTTLSEHLPQLRVAGEAGGLHLTAQLPFGADAEAAAEAARAEGIDIRSLSYYAYAPTPYEPALVIGYGRLSLATIPSFIASLARSVPDS
jgi:GntR family transcriptional regulator/MocR family aminotransferase